jgi:outer membrane protein
MRLNCPISPELRRIFHSYRMYQKIIVSVLFVSISVKASAQDSLSLRQLVKSAVQTHYAVQKTMLESQLQQEKARSEVAAKVLPQVALQVSADYNPFLPATVLSGDGLLGSSARIPVRLGLPFQSQTQLSAEQLIYSAEMRKLAPAKQVGEQLVQLLAEKSKEEAAYQVAQLFLQIKQTEAMGLPLLSNKIRLSALEKSVEAAVANGLAIKTDLKRIQSAQQMLTLQEQQLEEALAYQRALLSFVSRTEIPAAVGLKIGEPLYQAPQVQPVLVEKRLLEHQVALFQIKRDAANAERFPEVRAVAQVGLSSYRQRPFGADGGWYGAGLIGVRSRWNMFNSDKRNGKKREIDLEMRKIRLDLEQLDAVQRIETEFAEKSLRTAEQQVVLNDSARALAEEIWQGLKLQYKEGSIALKEVLEAQTALADAETKLATSKVAVQQAELKLLKASGQLSRLME